MGPSVGRQPAALWDGSLILQRHPQCLHPDCAAALTPQAAVDGCRLELPSPRPEPRRTNPAVPFMDAWLHQVNPGNPTLFFTRSSTCLHELHLHENLD